MVRVRAVAAALAVGVAVAFTLAQPGAAAAATKQPRGSVYLFLGLANIFSTGLDTLGEQLRARGVHNTVLNHGGWPGVADEIEARYKRDRSALPVVIMGHSFGADAAIAMSAELGTKGIPVALVVIFDATGTAPVPPNVRHVINYYDPAGVGKKLSPAKGFHGCLENIDVDKLKKDITHLTIEKNETFHRRAIAEVLGLLRGAPPQAGGR